MTNDQSLLRIGNLPVSPPLLLAPMAGLTHTALRTLLVELGGVGLLSTEMLSARTLPHENPEISPFLKRSAVERPLSYQLLVGEVAEVAPAVHALHRQGADVIDLNLGCPAPNVRRRGGGSRLSEQPEMVRLVVAEARRRTELPLTAKIRLGEELDAPRLRDFCQMLEAEGVDMISVHARLRGEPFCRKPRWEWVGKVKSWVKVPVIANGGIFSVEDASRCLELSGADGLMIGRAAPTKPWLFAEIGRELYGAAIAMPEVNLPAIYFRFSALLAERFAPERRLGRFKEFTHYYAKNYAFGHHLGAAVQSSSSMEQALERALDFFGRYDQTGFAGMGQPAAGENGRNSRF